MGSSDPAGVVVIVVQVLALVAALIAGIAFANWHIRMRKEKADRQRGVLLKILGGTVEEILDDPELLNNRTRQFKEALLAVIFDERAIQSDPTGKSSGYTYESFLITHQDEPYMLESGADEKIQENLETIASLLEIPMRVDE